MTNPYLSARQRAAPAANDTRHARLNVSSGGVAVARPRTLWPGIVDQNARTDGTHFDGLIVRDRGPFLRRPRVIPPGEAWVNWTKAGPWRPELHMRSSTLRMMGGNSASRYPVVDTPSTGRHTMVPSAVSRTAPRYVETQQMVPGRQNRLAPSLYRGQTFSQLTRPQGAR